MENFERFVEELQTVYTFYHNFVNLSLTNLSQQKGHFPTQLTPDTAMYKSF